jgi:hypothetical protein
MVSNCVIEAKSGAEIQPLSAVACIVVKFVSMLVGHVHGEVLLGSSYAECRTLRLGMAVKVHPCCREI